MSRKRFVAGIAVTTCLLALILFGFLYNLAHAPAEPKVSTPTPLASTEQPAAFDKTQYSTTDPASPWVIVNKQHPLNPRDYTPADLAAIGNGKQLRAEAAAELNKLFADAAAAGHNLIADSGYRSYQTQAATYAGYVKTYGQAYTDTVSARPGYSEHQTGWAVDIGTDGCHVDSCFADAAAGQWTHANAHKYGFVLRYPAALTTITGYSNEAWHFRYVGRPLSAELHAQNVQTLEQFFDTTGGIIYVP